MHAGATASVADSANGYAAYTLAPPDTDVLAVEFKINQLAPARGGGSRLRPRAAPGADLDCLPGRRLHDRGCGAGPDRYHALNHHRAPEGQR
jgi:acyl-coenzyme A thioesterase PaaI-like protein